MQICLDEKHRCIVGWVDGWMECNWEREGRREEERDGIEWRNGWIDLEVKWSGGRGWNGWREWREV